MAMCTVQSKWTDLGLSVVHGCGEESVGKMAFDQTRGRQLLCKHKLSHYFNLPYLLKNMRPGAQFLGKCEKNSSSLRICLAFYVWMVLLFLPLCPSM